jgi:hypothetical protein
MGVDDDPGFWCHFETGDTPGDTILGRNISRRESNMMMELPGINADNKLTLGPRRGACDQSHRRKPVRIKPTREFGANDYTLQVEYGFIEYVLHIRSKRENFHPA